MSTNPVLTRAQALWEGLAAAPVSFSSAERVNVVTAPRAMICPPGWAGFVVLQGRAIVTAPSPAAAVAIRRAIAVLSDADLVDPEALGRVLPLAESLGPATLAYLDEPDFRVAVSNVVPVDRLPAGHPDLRRLEGLAGEQGWEESGLGEITSPAFTVCKRGEVVAVAGYRLWPSRTAHLSVLTAPASRGQGLAQLTGSAAVAHALKAGLLPQWRARTPQSERVAFALGFRELGAQLSARLS